MDWMVQEQERGITITSRRHGVHLARNPHQYHRYARPRLDFTVEVERLRCACWTGLVALFRFGCRSAAAVRNGVASGEQVSRAARHLREQDGSHRSRFFNCVAKISRSYSAHARCRFRFPWARNPVSRGTSWISSR